MLQHFRCGLGKRTRTRQCAGQCSHAQESQDRVCIGNQCTVKHHTDIINFACMTWNFVRTPASLSALCTNFYLFDIGIAFLAKFYPILM